MVCPRLPSPGAKAVEASQRPVGFALMARATAITSISLTANDMFSRQVEVQHDLAVKYDAQQRRGGHCLS